MVVTYFLMILAWDYPFKLCLELDYHDHDDKITSLDIWLLNHEICLYHSILMILILVFINIYIHFLTECVSHLENRSILFDGITKEIPNFLIQSNKEKIISILTEQNMNVLLSLSIFIVKAWG